MTKQFPGAAGPSPHVDGADAAVKKIYITGHVGGCRPGRVSHNNNKIQAEKVTGYFGGEGSEAGDGLGHGGDSELEEVETCSDLVPGVIDDAGRRRDGDDSSSLRRRGEDPGPRPLPGHHPPWDSSGRPSVPTAKVVVVVG
eukprot:CAMPEP_0197421670 /NCGR_PEP_ID=MMETSP1170-20131217/10695_1 /TAXON_ID=54406 /ORGANISM="Sarcinochrysis sp, Strain CCMP770" /LENGTH=140 /DNA_ID=CAMNT_0042948939 /DNA_START=74 /DNA_END=497 /DNA_ORIENTATION=-